MISGLKLMGFYSSAFTFGKSAITSKTRTAKAASRATFYLGKISS